MAKSAMSQDDDTEIQRNQQALAEWSDEASDDLASLPVLTLVQKAGEKGSGLENAAGSWHLPGFDVFDAPVIVPMQIGKSRRFATLDDAGDIQTHCYAPVGVPYGIQRTEYGRDQVLAGVMCDSCPLAQWGEDEAGNRTPPLCDLEIQMRVIVADVMMPARMIFRRTAIPVAKSMAGILNMKGMRNVAFVMGSEFKKQGTYTWYVPKFKVITRPDDPMLPVAQEAMSFARSTVDMLPAPSEAPY